MIRPSPLKHLYSIVIVVVIMSVIVMSVIVISVISVVIIPVIGSVVDVSVAVIPWIFFSEGDHISFSYR